MINLILTTSASHFKDSFGSRKNFRLVVLGTNRDGKNIFPDGEVFVKLPELSKESRTVVLHSGAPNPNDGLAELEMILSILKRGGIQNVEVFFTYLPYGMQDKIHVEGETNAAEDLLRKLCEYYGVGKIYAIDPHFTEAPWLKGMPFVSVSAHETLLSAVRKNYPDAVFVSPDMGHETRTKGLMKGFQKTRTDSYTVTITHDGIFMSGIKGKTVAVVDDIIETGGTMIGFYNECEKFAPKEMVAVVTHGLLSSGIKRLKEKYLAVFISNTINQEEANVDISMLISRALVG